jgi:hypothetical protein
MNKHEILILNNVTDGPDRANSGMFPFSDLRNNEPLYTNRKEK